MTTLSQAVWLLRQQAEKSQRDFANTLGMSFSCFQKYEGGGRLQTPDARLLVAFLARAIDQSRPDLAAVFKHELISVLIPPPGFSVEITVKPTKGKRS